MRQAVSLLQNSHSIFKNELTAERVIEISGVVPDDVLTGLWDAARSRSFTRMEKKVAEVMSLGYNTGILMEQLLKKIIEADDISDLQKANVCDVISTADKCMADGADEYLQLLNVTGAMIKHF